MIQSPDLIKNKIKIALSSKLPGEASHMKMIPMKRKLNFSSDNIYVKHSSILILLFYYKNVLYTCLTKRPENMKYHAGQISFPGGQIEEKDQNAIYAALREANEEIGIIPEEIDILNKLTSIFIDVSKFIIYPIVGWSEKLPNFKINHNEVSRIILLPLSDKKSVTKEIIEKKTSYGYIKVPCYKYKNDIIWGATAMILSELFDILNNIKI